ncbi:GHMP kinase [Nocardiopsis ansamitocini]|uniref:Kinase n=1 Tax=Nocardiopsis ansamitocini TaxID=1670832 RepID=A0A9W6P215_9ACTN|nr:GHMP kinase [Nocardiopsis ansamitocini]GLU45657.1 kinase [Nocardiopsis ansamitocini]
MITGTGLAGCHHGEILQGVFSGEGGRPCRGLVTLPMSSPVARAVFTPLPGTPGEHIVLDTPGRTKAARAAALAVAECARLAGRPACGGRLRVGGGAAPGLGMGSSTSDVIASIRAVAASFGARPSPGVVARLAVRAERASDPIMLGDRPVLFAQREGRVLEDFGPVLPAMAVVGCLTGGGQPVSTLDLPGGAVEGDVADYELLRAALRAAITDGDAAGVGRVSTESARLNQRVLPKAEFATLQDVARRCGAVGVQVAHSGNVAGLLFDAGVPDLDARLRSCGTRLRDHGLTATRIFRTPPWNNGARSWTTTFPRRSADRI